MPTEHDTRNVVVAVEQSTKINETDGRLPEIRQSGETDRLREKGEESKETAVTAAVEDNASNLVGEMPPQSSSAKASFTDLSQVDSDFALARALQEQERVYMILRRDRERNNNRSWVSSSYVYDEDYSEDDEDYEDEYETDEDEGTNSGIQQVSNSNDEAYARAPQEAGARLTARLSALRVEDRHVEAHPPQDARDDDDDLTYEEMLALSEVVGTQSKGLSADTIAALPSKRYKDGDNQNGTNESCVICCLDYEDNDDLILLPCKHSFHPECITNWLMINKVCPICSAEIPTSSSGQSKCKEKILKANS